MRNAQPTFVTNYLGRLKLKTEDFIHPTIDNLRMIQEAHLRYIPFENLSQHGCAHPATISNLNDTAVKILEKNRGGFCLEVNGLLGELLVQLGYGVCRVPAYVYVNNEMFRDVPSHIILIVSCPNDVSKSTGPSLWVVDVGFGEPAIHPLRYDTFDEILATPDGMHSKICKANDGSDNVIMYWWHAPRNDWVPRLKWNFAASMLMDNDGPPLSAFTDELAATLEEKSIFSQKMICCRLTRDKKYTVAGNILKITGSPRFTSMQKYDGDSVPVVIREIKSEHELRSILLEYFDIPREATTGITLEKSIAADASIWSNQ
jgi:arylamine N-acetyltransferase